MLQSLLPKPPIIHLAFFHGIGVSQLALQYLNVNIIKTFSWEIDPFCNELLDHRYHQQIEHMGDATQTDFTTFCRQLSDTYDNSHVILITSAPPCKDHSRVRDAPPGVSGSDGSLIQQMTNIDLTIRQHLPTYIIRSLMENVLPHRDIQEMTSPRNGVLTQLLSMQQTDKSPQDPDSGGSTPIGSTWATNSQDRHHLHYIGRSKMDTTNSIIPSHRWSSHQYTWKIGRHRQYFATNTCSIALPHRLPLTWDDRHQPTHKQTMPPGSDGNKTIDSFHRGNTNHSSLLARTKASGNQSLHYNERDSWHCQMTTPRSQTNTHPPEPETPCWVTPGIFHQHFGYSHYYWWFLPAQHSVTHPHNPTYRNSRDCGLPPKRLGDHQPKPHTTNICHNSIGTATLGGPALYKTPQQIIAILIPAYVGLLTNLGAYPTYNRFDRQSQQNSDFWSRNIRRPQLRGLNRYHLTANSPTNRQTWLHKYQHWYTSWTASNIHTLNNSNRNSVKDSPYWDIYTQAWIGMSAPTPNTHLPPPSRHYDNTTEPTSTRNYSRTKSTHTGISWRTKSPQKSNKDVWLAPSKHQHGCRPTLHHWKNTHTLPFYYLFLTQIPLSQWPSASNRPDQMGNRRSDAERTGDALAITKHVTWQTNLITILQITTHGWHNIPDNDPTNHHWCGAMITTVHTDNYLLTILPSPMSCCLPQMAQPYGTIMYSFLDPQQACGPTTDSETCCQP